MGQLNEELSWVAYTCFELNKEMLTISIPHSLPGIKSIHFITPSCTMTGVPIWGLINGYLASHGMECRNIDGAPSMCPGRKYTAICTAVHGPQNQAHIAVFTERRGTGQILPLLLDSSLKQVVQIVDAIKFQPLSTHSFSMLCKEVGSAFLMVIIQLILNLPEVQI